MTDYQTSKTTDRQIPKMKISEAIVKGSKIRDHQAIDSLYAHGGTCALGAAIEGFFGQRVKWSKDDLGAFAIPRNGDVSGEVWLSKTFKDLSKRLPTHGECSCMYGACKFWHCDVCNDIVVDVQELIVHLNDDHGWARPRIAKLVESLGY